jgi:hypothetical protein
MPQRPPPGTAFALTAQEPLTGMPLRPPPPPPPDGVPPRPRHEPRCYNNNNIRSASPRVQAPLFRTRETHGHLFPMQLQQRQTVSKHSQNLQDLQGHTVGLTSLQPGHGPLPLCRMFSRTSTVATASPGGSETRQTQKQQQQPVNATIHALALRTVVKAFLSTQALATTFRAQSGGTG